jgi:hypothetical protein
MDGTIFYTMQSNNQGAIQAISPQGQNLWYSEVDTSAYYRSPVISATGKYIFLKDEAFNYDDWSHLKQSHAGMSPRPVLR